MNDDDDDDDDHHWRAATTAATTTATREPNRELLLFICKVAVFHDSNVIVALYPIQLSGISVAVKCAQTVPQVSFRAHPSFKSWPQLDFPRISPPHKHNHKQQQNKNNKASKAKQTKQAK